MTLDNVYFEHTKFGKILSLPPSIHLSRFLVIAPALFQPQSRLLPHLYRPSLCLSLNHWLLASAEISNGSDDAARIVVDADG